MISTKSIAHGRQTGTDIARSRRFYDAVFGWPVLLEAARRIPQVSSTAPSSRRAMVREDWASTGTVDWCRRARASDF